MREVNRFMIIEYRTMLTFLHESEICISAEKFSRNLRCNEINLIQGVGG